MQIIAISCNNSEVGIFFEKKACKKTFSICPNTLPERIYDSINSFLNQYQFDFGVIERRSEPGHSVDIENNAIIKLAFAQFQTPIIEIPAPVGLALGIGVNQGGDDVAFLSKINDKYQINFDKIGQANAFLLYNAVKTIMRTKPEMLTAAQKKIYDDIANAITK